MNTILTKEQIQDQSLDELLNHLRLSKVNSDEYVGLVPLIKMELELREPTINYKCKNCGHEKFNETTLYASGGGFSAIFEISTEKYRSISCKRCTFVELFEGRTSNTQVVLDVLFG